MPTSYLHPVSGNVAYNAQHSPMGAFFSFTCGNFGTPSGMAAQLGRPANQDLFIGIKEGDRRSDAPLRCLPFFAGASDASAKAYQLEQAQETAARPTLLAYSKDEIRRFYGWGSDRFVTDDFQFTIYTPFSSIPDPANSTVQQMREGLLPAIVAEFTVDNTHGSSTKTAVFAIRFTAEWGARVIDDLGAHRHGFGFRRHLGVAGEMLDGKEAFPIFRWAPDMALRDDNLVHHLGSCPGMAFEIPAGQKRTLRLAIGCYLEGMVTTRLDGRYLYTRYFASLNDVLSFALDEYEMLVVKASELDHRLATSRLSADQQFLLAHATRSYYGSTELLEVAGQPFWIVNEGEYVMMNTLDLAVDQVFWELRQNPWVVRNLLDSYVRYYSYRDHVKVPDGKGSFTLAPGGISFGHEMGSHNNFSPLHQSGYEMPELDAVCFSYMTQEQLCNWTLMAGCYAATTGDAQWLHHNAPTLRDCLLSMQNRDHVDPAKRTGVMQLDSSQCGRKGSEITTYDSLDHSLAQSRNNLYIAVKCWATYLSLSLMFRKLGDASCEQQAMHAADLAAKTVASKMGPESFIPAVFEADNPGHTSRILPAIEGLIYPLYWRELGEQIGADALEPAGRFSQMLDALRKHTQTLLSDPEGRNRFPDGGIRLSSTSGNSWLSKIAIVQHVARAYFGMERGDARQQAADAAHIKWVTEGDSAYWAMSDQILNGTAQGSKYYPRGISMALWL